MLSRFVSRGSQSIRSQSVFSLSARAFSAAKRKILIPTALAPAAKTILEENGFDVVLDDKTPVADLLKAHSDAYGLIVRSEKVTQEVIDSLPSLKVIVRAGAGYNTIDIKAARKAGIDVMNTPGANANAVAEEVVVMALAAFRYVVPADISTRAGLWEKKKFLGRELSQKTVGIVGLGNIGQLVAKRMSGFDCKFIGYDPMISPQLADKLGVKLVSMEELFTKSDVVTLHIPETPETKKSINKSLLSLMPEGACLINCARQGIINEEDLAEVKKTKKLLYCTDVYVKDEAGDKSIKDVADIMLPHIGANTKEANLTAAKRAATQIVEWTSIGTKRYVVNKSVPEDLDENYQRLAFYLARVASKFRATNQNQPHAIETSFYGDLNKHSKWLTPSVLLGVSGDFDPTFDASDAETFLKDMGIQYTTRVTDEKKGYGESVTVDLFSGSGDNIEKVSVRGTLTEGSLMVSRINNFDGLYFNPIGFNCLVEYKDRPGVLAAITQIIAKHGNNITDIRAPQVRSTTTPFAPLGITNPTPVPPIIINPC
jgi:D-3-phosphoglycerate dehydrogenase